ncbi:TPR domain protein [Talaromyces stipitatus ATCC 10500]|uniref:TPR domain protein n=1 Tax=Talaromyces stipitatus (strain ATCC 10500 / CBS 375.48 / QM 6759 / NRRL 1006) TaxID=441959 RepID=B8LWF5_TALSN|nr:TPR domain protein [Talaromyces stipitatus ATCC 10500]EED24266.1 TPR domain protein [Talaromyces stipitatus ATCC 10500]
MGKSRTKNKKSSTKSEKSVLHSVGKVVSKRKMADNATELLEKATILLQTGQAEAALPLAQRILEISEENSADSLSAINLVGEIYVELGEIDAARESFLHAVQLDPEGTIPESQGGGAEKFLWLAQLSEQGGADSVAWYEKGVGALRHIIQSLEQNGGSDTASILDEKRKKLAVALCGVVELYMTDLSWEEDAESRCETLITEALLVAPDQPDCLQTLASVRISQARIDDARAALSRSLELWQDLPPEDPKIPDFPSRISLSRLLMEVQMEVEALQVLERLILEDDESVEAWYLGGWCLYLLAEKEKQDSSEEKRHESMVASREWLKQSLKLYQKLEYEDERLRDHALELVQELNKELGDDMDDDSDDGPVFPGGDEDEEDWDGEIEAESDDDEDHEMKDS